MTQMMNPVRQVQREIAQMLTKEPWFMAHAVEIVEQNAQALAFLLKKNLATVNHVLLVVGVDRITNDHTAIECEITVTCTEHVMANRVKQGSVTAIDVCQAAVQVIDGQWWHFTTMQHTTEPGTDTLQATASFKGLVNREFLDSPQEGGGENVSTTETAETP